MHDQTYIAHRTRTAAAGERQKGDERIGKQAKGQGPKRFGDRDEKIYLLGLIAMAFTACGASRLLFKPTKHPCLAEPPPADESPKHKKKQPKIRLLLAVRRGLEPLTPCVTGTYSNQLN